MELFNSDSEELLPCDGSAVLHRNVWSDDVQRRYFDELLAQVPWIQPELEVFNRRVPQPRLTSWFGDEGHVYTYSRVRLEPRPWTPLLLQLKLVCEELAGSSFNSVLLNLYRDGRDGVSWHADNERELGHNPIIASVSLGATRRFDLRHRRDGSTIKTELHSGNVVVMSGPCQECWLHQVPKTARQVGPRINLTFRTIHV